MARRTIAAIVKILALKVNGQKFNCFEAIGKLFTHRKIYIMSERTRGSVRKRARKKKEENAERKRMEMKE